MASEWPRLSLQEANVELIDCDHRTTPASDGGYPYVAIPQLSDGCIKLSEARRIKPEHYVEWTRKAKPAAYDVVLSRRCNPGETAVVEPGMEFALGQNLVLLRADGTRVYPPFLRWLVRGLEWWEQVGKFINVGAVFGSLKCADIPNFQLRIPPLPEQRTIAHILGTLDDKIELNRRMNETLEAMARALFQSWFVDFDPVRARAEGRDPGLPKHLSDLFSGHFEDSELGEIPVGWGVGSLENIASVTMGLSPDGASYNVNGLGTPLINGPVEFGDHFPVKTKWTTLSTRLAQAGDLILCLRGSTTGRRVVADDSYCLGRGVCAIRPNRGMRTFL
jgi:type I restriction enzyme S subunit